MANYDVIDITILAGNSKHLYGAYTIANTSIYDPTWKLYEFHYNRKKCTFEFLHGPQRPDCGGRFGRDNDAKRIANKNVRSAMQRRIYYATEKTLALHLLKRSFEKQ